MICLLGKALASEREPALVQDAVEFFHFALSLGYSVFESETEARLACGFPSWLDTAAGPLRVTRAAVHVCFASLVAAGLPAW